MQVCSPQWLSAAAVAVADLRVDDQIDAAVCQVIDSEFGDRSFRIALSNGTVTIAAGDPIDGDVVLRTSLDTARMLASGTQPAQQAVLAGDVRISGDVSRLVVMSDSMAAVAAAMAPLWATTEF